MNDKSESLFSKICLTHLISHLTVPLHPKYRTVISQLAQKSLAM